MLLDLSRDAAGKGTVRRDYGVSGSPNVIFPRPVPVAVAYPRGMSEEMTYGHLGRSGLMVSRIGLGP